MSAASEVDTSLLGEMRQVVRRLEKVAERMEENRPVPVGATLQVRDCWKLVGIRNASSWSDFCEDFNLRHLPERRGMYLRSTVLRAIERRDAGRISAEGIKRREAKKKNPATQSIQP